MKTFSLYCKKFNYLCCCCIYTRVLRESFHKATSSVDSEFCKAPITIAYTEPLNKLDINIERPLGISKQNSISELICF